MQIRTATAADLEAIRQVTLSAFPEEERDVIAKLAADLLAEKTTPHTFSLVAVSEAAKDEEIAAEDEGVESNGTIVGHIAFSPFTLKNNKHLQGYILAPLSVIPTHQNCGIGSKLVRAGIQQLSEQQVDVVIVYGDPKYYGRFGFSADAATNYLPPHAMQYPFGWQAIALNPSNTAKSPTQITCVQSLSDPTLW